MNDYNTKTLIFTPEDENTVYCLKKQSKLLSNFIEDLSSRRKAFHQFCFKHRVEVKSNNPTMNAEELGSILLHKWKDLNEQEKAQFMEIDSSSFLIDKKETPIIDSTINQVLLPESNILEIKKLESELKEAQLTYNTILSQTNKTDNQFHLYDNTHTNTTLQSKSDLISALHEYNEIKDITQMLLGKLSEFERCQTKDLYPRYKLSIFD